MRKMIWKFSRKLRKFTSRDGYYGVSIPKSVGDFWWNTSSNRRVCVQYDEENDCIILSPDRDPLNTDQKTNEVL